MGSKQLYPIEIDWFKKKNLMIFLVSLKLFVAVGFSLLFLLVLVNYLLLSKSGTSTLA